MQQKSVKIIPLQFIFPRIFNPFRAKIGQNSSIFAKNINIFQEFSEISTLTVQLYFFRPLQCILDILEKVPLAPAHTRRSFFLGPPPG